MENAQNNKLHTNFAVECGKSYRFRKEFCPMLGISDYQVTRRKEDLLVWLTNFFNYDFKESPRESAIITIKEIYGDYQQMPRKLPKNEKYYLIKKEKYGEYTKNSLTEDFQPESGRHIARKAITKFGYNDFGHKNDEYVSRTFIQPALKLYGEKSNHSLWVWYSTYQPLTPEELSSWYTILKEEKIDMERAANAFYKYVRGAKVEQEISAFKMAMDRSLERYGDFPVNVGEWRLRQACQKTV